jgi:hypothetical protein
MVGDQESRTPVSKPSDLEHSTGSEDLLVPYARAASLCTLSLDVCLTFVVGSCGSHSSEEGEWWASEIQRKPNNKSQCWPI